MQVAVSMTMSLRMSMRVIVRVVVITLMVEFAAHPIVLPGLNGRNPSTCALRTQSVLSLNLRSLIVN